MSNSSKPLSLTEKLAKRKADPTIEATLKEIGAAMVEDQEVQADPWNTGLFVKLCRTADQIGLKMLCSEMPAKEAEKLWATLNFEQIIGRLEGWSRNNAKAKEALATLQEYCTNPFVVGSMWKVVVRIDRPLREVTNEDGLFDFLMNFITKRRDDLVLKIVNPQSQLDKSEICFMRGRDRNVFAPMKQPKNTPKNFIQLGWQFVQEKKAEFDAHQNAHQKKLDNLKAKATLDPAEALAGDIGFVFVPLGTMWGILFETATNGEVRIFEAVGAEIKDGTPSEWFSWDDDIRSFGQDAVNAVTKLKGMANAAPPKKAAKPGKPATKKSRKKAKKSE